MSRPSDPRVPAALAVMVAGILLGLLIVIGVTQLLGRIAGLP